jgi:protein-disulfide isomerase
MQGTEGSRARIATSSKIQGMAESLRMVVLAAFVAISAQAIAADASLLKPPPGAKAAIVVFEDLQCPECSRAYPLIWEAASAHQIPVVLHDFPLPMHNWAFESAVWARYFDKTSVDLGNEFRKFIYTNQIQITRENLLKWVQKFAADNKAEVPLVNDPDGKLTGLVRADYLLGQRIGVEHTPTIWVVGNGAISQPLVEEVKDRGKLEQMIEEVLSKAQAASPAPKATVPKKSAVKTPKKAG